MSRRFERLGRLALAALLGALAACAPQGDGTMVSIPPPRGWEERLLADRQSKDEGMRRDPDTPLLAEDLEDFEGLDYWPPDPALYFVGSILRRPGEEPEPFTIVTTSGQQRPCEKFGYVAFEIEGRRHTLQVYRLLDIDDLFLPFMDATTGEETYPSGRYLDLRGPAGGPYVLDFNRAYNPLCAYGDPDRYACPVTPAENRLDVRIEAGERGFREAPGTR